MSSDKKSRTVKLFCPSLSKLVPRVIKKKDENLDLRLIATAFGLEPSTLKINNHGGRSNPWEIGSGDDMSSECNGISNNTKGSMEDINLFKKIKTNAYNSGVCQPLSASFSGSCAEIKINGVAAKRKHLVEDINSLKKNKMSKSSSGKLNFPITSSVVRSVHNCIGRSISRSLKRTRIDEMVMAAPSKRQIIGLAF